MAFDSADITRPLRDRTEWGHRQARIAGLDFPFVGAPIDQRLDRIEFAIVEMSDAIARLGRSSDSTRRSGMGAEPSRNRSMNSSAENR
jgi:hypothetical protein